MTRVAVIGSMNADLTVRTARLPGPGETVSGSELEINPGGKSSNQAAVVARLGGESALLAVVGDDDHGALLREQAERAGTDVGWIVVEKGATTGTALIAVDDDAENFIIISAGANALVTPELVEEHADILDGAGALCLCLEVDQDAVLAAARAAHDRDVAVVLNLSPYAEVAPELLELTDVLLVNEHELANLTGHDGDDALASAQEALAGLGVERAVVTLGARGALVVDGEQTEQVPSPKVRAVDTTGCGDAFTGSLAHYLCEGDGLVDAARKAAVVAACAATKDGAQRSYPTADELAAFTKETGQGAASA